MWIINSKSEIDVGSDDLEWPWKSERERPNFSGEFP